MKSGFKYILFIASLLFAVSSFSYASEVDHLKTESTKTILVDDSEEHGAPAEHQHAAPWSVIPFVILLLMIATGPLFYAHFWHKRYPLIAMLLGVIVIVYYVMVLGNSHNPIHSMHEYISFIALLTPLFVASGGVLIKVDKQGTPMVNIALLIIGAILANIVGTTGASMLLIRPFIRLNQNRIKPYHIVFFIFIVSNVGGALTPIGDPPLFLGFLKGVPFFWTLNNLWVIWAFGVVLLSLMFYVIDSRNKAGENAEDITYSNKIEIKGLKSTIWLAITIAAVFIDPAVIEWVPGIDYHGTKLSFIREIIMFGAAFMAYKTASKECLEGNEFSFEPIREVAFLFVGIFATMIPALELVNGFANSPEGRDLVTTTTLYWTTGGLSGILDNAPTYLTFLAAGMGKVGLDISNNAHVLQFTQGENIINLMSISIAAVFFGAFTYIGNAPNFMVKSIAEQVGIEMPSFFGYVVKYSIPILLPIFFVTWLLFFSGYIL